MSTPNSCIDDGVCEVTEKLQRISTIDNNVSVCANCGKEGSSDNMNICNKCKVVKYCNAACKKKHRHKHKKDCEEHVRLAAERAAVELFKQPETEDDCPICFQKLPVLNTGWRYQTCCGKEICSGCIFAPVYDNQGNVVAEKKCPFCRTPYPTTDEELTKRRGKRVEMNDPIAIHNRGNYYRDGRSGFPIDYKKALELYHRAGELGYAGAHLGIGDAYYHGKGVEVDKKKAKHYYELAAMGGDAAARYNLDLDEEMAGNIHRALKHHMIAIGGGYATSLNKIKWLYTNGHATKEDYTGALQYYQKYLVEIKSVQRDKAAAFSDEYRYY